MRGWSCVACCIAFCLFLAGCGGSPSATVERAFQAHVDTIKDVYQYVEDGDDVIEDISEIKLDIEDEDIDDDDATVEFSLSDGDEKECELDLEKKDGKWLIVSGDSLKLGMWIHQMLED